MGCVGLGFGGRSVRRHLILGRQSASRGGVSLGLLLLPVRLVCLDLRLGFGIGGNLELARLAFLVYFLDGNDTSILGRLYGFTRIRDLRLLIPLRA